MNYGKGVCQWRLPSFVAAQRIDLQIRFLKRENRERVQKRYFFSEQQRLLLNYVMLWKAPSFCSKSNALNKPLMRQQDIETAKKEKGSKCEREIERASFRLSFPPSFLLPRASPPGKSKRESGKERRR